MDHPAKTFTGVQEVMEKLAGKFLCQDGVYLSPARPDKISYPEDWNERFYSIEDESYWFRHRNEVIKTVIQRFGIRGVMLDVGGGNGFVTRMLAEIGLDPILVEPYLQGCRNAQKRGVQNVICGHLKDLDSRAARVGCIGIFDVLEHVEQEDEFLQAIHGALSDQGKLLIAVPAYPQLWSADDEQAGHYRRYSPKQLNALLGRNGFRVSFCSYFFNCLLVPVFLFRRLPRMLKSVANINHYKFEEKQHVVRGRVTRRILSSLFRAELKRLQKGKVASGTSILVVAEKAPA